LYVSFLVKVEEERAAIDEDASPVKLGQIKRPRLNTVGVGKASGRTWKAPAQRASSTKSRTLSSSWEKKMKIKAERDAYNSMKRQAKEARSTRLREARERKEQAEKRKEENRKKSVVVQKLSTETAKRMMKSKKQRKKLATA
jgi:rRNA-processing protein CGR1